MPALRIVIGRRYSVTCVGSRAVPREARLVACFTRSWDARRSPTWVYVAGPLLGAAIAIGCAIILRGRGGNPVSHAAGSGVLTPGRAQQAAKLSKDIDNGKEVPPSSCATGAGRS
jgi:hypothetical protein